MQAQFEADAFGGENGSLTSAYLPFYARVDERAEIRILDQRGLQFDQEMMQRVKDDNERFLLERWAFSEPFA
jgi:hypothetical protein